MRWSNQARLILRIAAELNQGRLGKADDWSQLDPRQDPLFTQPSEVTAFRTGLYGARTCLGIIVSVTWMEPGAIRPDFRATEHGWRVGFYNTARFGLFGVLASHLMLAISGTVGVACCSNCGEVYRPKRAVRSDRDNFCTDCGKKARTRLAMRRFRANARSSRGSAP